MNKERLKEIGRSIAVGLLVILFVYAMVFRGF
jgi:hypothetical protein